MKLKYSIYFMERYQLRLINGIKYEIDFKKNKFYLETNACIVFNWNSLQSTKV